MLQNGNYYINITHGKGSTEDIFCGPLKNDVITKLYELDAQGSKDNPTTINKIFYVNLNGTIMPFRVQQKGDKLILVK